MVRGPNQAVLTPLEIGASLASPQGKGRIAHQSLTGQRRHGEHQRTHTARALIVTRAVRLNGSALGDVRAKGFVTLSAQGD